jgi:hypothetical protein
MESLVDMGLPAFAIAVSLSSLHSHQDFLLGIASPAPHEVVSLQGTLTTLARHFILRFCTVDTTKQRCWDSPFDQVHAANTRCYMPGARTLVHAAGVGTVMYLCAWATGLVCLCLGHKSFVCLPGPQDKAVAAVVLRVDSPGGDALASDLMWREVVKLGERG